MEEFQNNEEFLKQFSEVYDKVRSQACSKFSDNDIKHLTSNKILASTKSTPNGNSELLQPFHYKTKGRYILGLEETEPDSILNNSKDKSGKVMKQYVGSLTKEIPKKYTNTIKRMSCVNNNLNAMRSTNAIK